MTADIDQAADRLDELVSFAAGNRPLSGDTRSWLAAGLERHLADGESLEAALGLSAERRPRARTRLLLARRNHHLCRAWRLIEASGPWTTTLALAKEIASFETRVWPRWRELAAPPPGCSALRRELFLALATGKRIDLSIEHLHEICTGKTAL